MISHTLGNKLSLRSYCLYVLLIYYTLNVSNFEFIYNITMKHTNILDKDYKFDPKPSKKYIDYEFKRLFGNDKKGQIEKIKKFTQKNDNVLLSIFPSFLIFLALTTYFWFHVLDFSYDNFAHWGMFASILLLGFATVTFSLMSILKYPLKLINGIKNYEKEYAVAVEILNTSLAANLLLRTIFGKRFESIFKANLVIMAFLLIALFLVLNAKLFISNIKKTDKKYFVMSLSLITLSLLMITGINAIAMNTTIHPDSDKYSLIKNPGAEFKFIYIIISLVFSPLAIYMCFLSIFSISEKINVVNKIALFLIGISILIMLFSINVYMEVV